MPGFRPAESLSGEQIKAAIILTFAYQKLPELLVVPLVKRIEGYTYLGIKFNLPLARFFASHAEMCAAALKVCRELHRSRKF